MSSSEGPRPGLDRGIAALRWLLVSAQDDSSARREALPALSRVTVLVPTVAGATDKLRYLPQPVGGHAMVVFTGHDALEHAAKKLGWSQGASGVSFRAMRGRDALDAALNQGLRAVVVDLGAEHALELKHEEVSEYFSRGTGEFSPESLTPSSRGTGEHAPPPPRRSAVPMRESSVDARGTGERGIADVREVAGPRKARDARRDESERPKRRASTPTGQRSSRPSKKPSRDVKAPAEAKAPPARQQTAPMPGIKQPARKQNLAEIDDPFISSPPRPAPSAPPLSAGGRARRVPSLAAPPLSSEMPSSPFETTRPPSGPQGTDEAPGARARHSDPRMHRHDETIPLEDISSADAARESALRQQSTPAPMFSSADSSPVEPWPEHNLPSAAPGPLVDAAPSAPPASFSDAPAAVIAPVPVRVIAPIRAADPPEFESRGVGLVAKPPPAAAPAVEPASGADVAELSDTVLAAIADEMRKFPEVEWACVLPDDDKHLIGVRVDPSYLTRTQDIEASLIGAAKKAGAFVQPLVVSSPAATKDARTRGRMFFPWKRKK